MKIILIHDYPSLGKKGDIKNVSTGFARNFLIPYDKAIFANKKNINKYNEHLLVKQKLHLKLLEESHNKQKKIENLKHIDVYVRSNKSGKLFGSITVKDIINILKRKDIIIKITDIILPCDKFSYIGTYNIYFKLYDNIQIPCLLNLIRTL